MTLKDYSDNIKIKLNYYRTIGDLDDPDFQDFSFFIKRKNKSNKVIQLWVDYKEKTITVTSGCYHDEPVEKDIVDFLVESLELEKFMINM